MRCPRHRDADAPGPAGTKAEAEQLPEQRSSAQGRAGRQDDDMDEIEAILKKHGIQ